MKAMRTMADLKSDPRIGEVNDERRDGMGLWAYANDRDGYFIEGGSDTGSYVQIHEDSLREVLKQANRIKHFSEFSESEKENLRRWAESNRYNLKENPMKSDIKVGDKVMGIMGVSGGYAGTVIAIKRDGRHNVVFYKDDDGAVYETLDSNITKNVPEKGKFPRKNPLKPRRGESYRDFVSRCMGEEKMSFPEPKQRIAVCLSKSRKRNPVFDTGADE